MLIMYVAIDSTKYNLRKIQDAASGRSKIMTWLRLVNFLLEEEANSVKNMKMNYYMVLKSNCT